jgi:hypothetical protein
MMSVLKVRAKDKKNCRCPSSYKDCIQNVYKGPLHFAQSYIGGCQNTNCIVILLQRSKHFNLFYLPTIKIKYGCVFFF